MGPLGKRQKVSESENLNENLIGSIEKYKSQNSFEHFKVFNDSIHGHIEIHPLCLKIIDTHQFQRLRYIKQLGAVCFVFPSASHNRFEHSLGVCHLAGTLTRALKSRQPELGITDKDILCVEIAGLCHDLGHGPFSHLWEKFIYRVNPDSDWKHEAASVEMFEYLLAKNNLKDDFVSWGLEEEDIIFIKEQIVGPIQITDDWPYKGRSRQKSFLYEIVANKRSGIDVDKWDYFLRDSQNLGIHISFDYTRFVKFARVIDVVDEGLQICIRDKEALNLYDMFYTRAILHRRAYQHRVTKVIEEMLVDAFLQADRFMLTTGENGCEYSLSEACVDMSAYCKLTDYIFNQILLSSDKRMETAQALLERIEHRDLYAFIGSTRMKQGITRESEMELQTDFSKFLPPESCLSTDDLVVFLMQVSYGMRDKNPVEEVRFYNKAKPNEARQIQQNEVSKMLPERYQEESIQVCIKKRDEESIKLAKQCLQEWCEKRGYEKPFIDFWPSYITSVKIYAQGRNNIYINPFSPAKSKLEMSDISTQEDLE